MSLITANSFCVFEYYSTWGWNDRSVQWQKYIWLWLKVIAGVFPEDRVNSIPRIMSIGPVLRRCSWPENVCFVFHLIVKELLDRFTSEKMQYFWMVVGIISSVQKTLCLLRIPLQIQFSCTSAISAACNFFCIEHFTQTSCAHGQRKGGHGQLMQWP